jgi:hypothetical protein
MRLFRFKYNIMVYDNNIYIENDINLW